MKACKTSNSLINNTVMLYILQFSNYFFNFIVIPYQTRVMGPEYFGKIGFATALMVYYQLFTDYGFILSGTEKVSKNKDKPDVLSKLYTSIFCLKIVFSLISVISLVCICIHVKGFRTEWKLYALYLMSTLLFSYMPDYLYRGLEKMQYITIRTVFVKTFSTICIFIFVKQPTDYYLVPLFLGIGNLFAVIWANYDIIHNRSIHFCRVSMQDIKEEFLYSTSFFLSRIATTIYTATNTMLLGGLDSTGKTVGLYSVADKLISTGKNVLTPISDSVYPYMMVNKDFKMIKRIIKTILPLITCACVVAFVFAPQICSLLFGQEYVESANILRAFLPMGIIALPSYLLGFPTLGALGLAKHANYSIYFGTAIHVANLFLFYQFDLLNVVSLALLTTLTDALILFYRILVIVIYRRNKR